MFFWGNCHLLGYNTVSKNRRRAKHTTISINNPKNKDKRVGGRRMQRTHLCQICSQWMQQGQPV